MSMMRIARNLMAICQPLTGERATGQVQLLPKADIVVDPHSYLFPVVNNQVRHDLVFKTAINPAQPDGVWPAPKDVATNVSIVSNIGGVRHNLAPGTEFVVEQPWRYGLPGKPRSLGGTSGATDPADDDLALYNFVSYESFGSKPTLDLFRSSIGGKFPAAMVCWMEGEPADGMSTSGVSRPTKRGAGRISYSDIFEIMIFSSRADSEHERRGQGLRILDEMCALLVDRMAVDGEALSSPGGLHIRKRYRAPSAGDGFYKVFQVYIITLSVQSTMVQRDTRAYNPLLGARIDAPREDHPTDDDPDAQDLPLVVNNRVSVPQ